MILDRFRMTDQVAIVTGAGRGIGEGCALAFAEQGADLVLAARTPDQLEAVAASVRGLGRRALVVPTDVNEPSALQALVERALAEFGRIDVLVNNAGGSPPRPRAPDQREDVRVRLPLQRDDRLHALAARDPAHAEGAGADRS